MYEMNVVSFILGLAAVVVFAGAIVRAPRATWAGLPLGLLLVTAAWLIQLTWNTPHTVHF